MKESIFSRKWTKHPVPERTHLAPVTSKWDILLASKGEEESSESSHITVGKLLPFCEDELAKLICETSCHMGLGQIQSTGNCSHKSRSGPRQRKNCQEGIQPTRYDTKESEFLKLMISSDIESLLLEVLWRVSTHNVFLSHLGSLLMVFPSRANLILHCPAEKAWGIHTHTLASEKTLHHIPVFIQEEVALL